MKLRQNVNLSEAFETLKNQLDIGKKVVSNESNDILESAIKYAEGYGRLEGALSAFFAQTTIDDPKENEGGDKLPEDDLPKNLFQQ